MLLLTQALRLWIIVMTSAKEHCDDKGVEHCDDSGHGTFLRYDIDVAVTSERGRLASLAAGYGGSLSCYTSRMERTVSRPLST